MFSHEGTEGKEKNLSTTECTEHTERREEGVGGGKARGCFASLRFCVRSFFHTETRWVLTTQSILFRLVRVFRGPESFAPLRLGVRSFFFTPRHGKDFLSTFKRDSCPCRQGCRHSQSPCAAMCSLRRDGYML